MYLAESLLEFPLWKQILQTFTGLYCEAQETTTS
jgi:hypothetical protein